MAVSYSGVKAALGLLSHPEGGYYKETQLLQEKVPSPFADGAERSLATQIYYLLDAQSSKGRMHMNKSVTFHLLHHGRAKYTLVRPSPTNPSGPPEIKYAVIGSDLAAGEVLQLFVEGGWWKASEILEEDLGKDPDHVGCLISEVVVPGFAWQDHAFLTRSKLVELFRGDEESADFKKLLQYVKAE